MKTRALWIGPMLLSRQGLKRSDFQGSYSPAASRTAGNTASSSGPTVVVTLQITGYMIDGRREKSVRHAGVPEIDEYFWVKYIAIVLSHSIVPNYILVNNAFCDKYLILALNIPQKKIKPRKSNSAKSVLNYFLEVFRFLLDGFSSVAYLLPKVETNDGNRRTAVYKQLRV